MATWPRWRSPNTTSQTATIPVIIRDDTGNIIRNDSISLGALAHTSFSVQAQFPITLNKLGTIEFDTPPSGQISVLGLTFAPGVAFSTVPPLVK